MTNSQRYVKYPNMTGFLQSHAPGGVGEGDSENAGLFRRIVIAARFDTVASKSLSPLFSRQPMADKHCVAQAEFARATQ